MDAISEIFFSFILKSFIEDLKTMSDGLCMISSLPVDRLHSIRKTIQKMPNETTGDRQAQEIMLQSLDMILRARHLFDEHGIKFDLKETWK